mmetsp:Transcript_18875/g.40563  ORF Transcript_18875/g.40563 Transcript_18875/m.40563 type:complete len:222 (+) Transcript_18875:1843-2508(+)
MQEVQYRCCPSALQRQPWSDDCEVKQMPQSQLEDGVVPESISALATADASDAGGRSREGALSPKSCSKQASSVALSPREATRAATRVVSKPIETSSATSLSCFSVDRAGAATASEAAATETPSLIALTSSVWTLSMGMEGSLRGSWVWDWSGWAGSWPAPPPTARMEPPWPCTFRSLRTNPRATGTGIGLPRPSSCPIKSVSSMSRKNSESSPQRRETRGQ